MSELDAIWPQVVEGFKRALKRDRDGGTLEELYESVRVGRRGLVRLPHGWAIVEVDGRLMNVVAAYGQATQESIAALKELCRSFGCEALRCSAWGATARLFKRLGWAPIYEVLEIR